MLFNLPKMGENYEFRQQNKAKPGTFCLTFLVKIRHISQKICQKLAFKRYKKSRSGIIFNLFFDLLQRFIEYLKVIYKRYG